MALGTDAPCDTVPLLIPSRQGHRVQGTLPVLNSSRLTVCQGGSTRRMHVDYFTQ